MPAPPLRKLLWTFFRIGNTTFGGGYPTMAAFQREFVDKEKWITQEQYGLAFSLARITPGTTLLAFCAATGGQILGVPGAMVAVLAETLPSALLAVLLTDGYQRWISHPLVAAVVAGTGAAVAGMLLSAALYISRPYLGSKKVELAKVVRAVGIGGASFLASWRFDVNPIPIMAIAAVAGLVWKEPGER